MESHIRKKLKEWAAIYNDPQYFKEDPIACPTHFAQLYLRGERDVRDVEVSAVISCHLAWGRRSMIVKDIQKAMDEMHWKPYDYVMRGEWRNDSASLHRTIKWSEFASICSNLKEYFSRMDSLEKMSVEEIRCSIYNSKPDKKAPNKKINMMRRWMVRNDGIVDLGIWRNSNPQDLIIPLDVHVYDEAVALGLTSRKQKDIQTAMEITEVFKDIFPGDPCKGDFALFGYGVNH